MLKEDPRYALVWRKQRIYFALVAALVLAGVLDLYVSFAPALKGSWLSTATACLWGALLVLWVFASRWAPRLPCPCCGQAFAIKQGEKWPGVSFTGIPSKCANCGLRRGAVGDSNVADARDAS